MLRGLSSELVLSSTASTVLGGVGVDPNICRLVVTVERNVPTLSIAFNLFAFKFTAANFSSLLLRKLTKKNLLLV